jgi:hypothetical protein
VYFGYGEQFDEAKMKAFRPAAFGRNLQNNPISLGRRTERRSFK